VLVELDGSEATTDETGTFELVASGAGILRFSKRGWHPAEVFADETTEVEVTLEPVKMRGVRVGADAAGDDDHFARLLDLAATTAVNTFVFDTKQEGGKVVYDTSVPTAHQIGAVEPWYDPAARVAAAREAGLYTVTRVVVFEDSFWVAAHPADRLAGSWVDPRSVGAREYATDLAVEACALGFDEIQLDYVRYPSGRTGRVSGQLALSQEERVQAIASFVSEVREAVNPMGCSLSADLFGIVVSVQNDQGIGQRPEELSPYLDAISPMVYPNHYSLGWLGFSDPNEHPHAVTANALDAALPRLTEGTVLRPWLQAFSWSEAQIFDSVRAAEERDLGWMLWNEESVYNAAAIPTEIEAAD
jgi:hypothetical protein